MTRILVGVDASDASIDALKRAAEEARWRESTLEVVYVFEPHQQVAAYPVLPERGTDRAPDMEEQREKARKSLGNWLDEIAVDFDGIDVEHSVLAERKIAQALIERSKDADLVVVGSRGRGGFAGLRLGSVSEQVTRHAKCPVLVVRESTKE
ncbi:MAG: universal stress protein [Nitriliruptor sp.]|nr:MAG: universal stress protein [Nitriliruptor sp.]